MDQPNVDNRQIEKPMANVESPAAEETKRSFNEE